MTVRTEILEWKRSEISAAMMGVVSVHHQVLENFTENWTEDELIRCKTAINFGIPETYLLEGLGFALYVCTPGRSLVQESRGDDTNWVYPNPQIIYDQSTSEALSSYKRHQLRRAQDEVIKTLKDSPFDGLSIHTRPQGTLFSLDRRKYSIYGGLVEAVPLSAFVRQGSVRNRQ